MLLAVFIEVAEKLAVPVGIILGVLTLIFTRSGRKDVERLMGKTGEAAPPSPAESFTASELQRRSRRTRFWLAFFIFLTPVGCIGPLALIRRIPGDGVQAILGPTALVLFMTGLVGTVLMAYDLARYKRGLREQRRRLDRVPDRPVIRCPIALPDAPKPVSDQQLGNLGPMRDVASPASWKPIYISALWLLPGLGLVVTFVVMCFRLPVAKNPSLVVVPLFPLAMGAWCVINSNFWLNAASRRDFYLHAGPLGVSARVPGGMKWHGFGYEVVDVQFAWSEIRHWFPFLHVFYSIPIESGLLFTKPDGGRIFLNTCCFAQSRHQLAQNITKAATEPFT